MKPLPAALWIAKFVTALFLLLVVVPAGLFFGGVYVWSRWEEHKAAVIAKHQAEFNTEKSKAIAEADAKEDAKLPPLPAGYEFSEFQSQHSDQLQSCLDAIGYSAAPAENPQIAVKAAVSHCYALDDARPPRDKTWQIRPAKE